MTTEQVQSLVEQHPNLTQEQKEKILKNLQVVTLAQDRRADITLSSTGQQSIRQFPFNAGRCLSAAQPQGGRGKTSGGQEKTVEQAKQPG